MKILPFFALVFTSLCIFSCKNDCPESYVFEEKAMPDWVIEQADLFDFPSMTFMDRNGDTIVFNRYLREINKPTRMIINQVDCMEDSNSSVDIYFHRTRTKVFYASDNQDTIGFQYYTQLPSFGDFSYDEFDMINEDYPYPMFTVYRSAMLKTGFNFYSLTSLAQEKGPSVFKTFLTEDYSLLNVSFSDVFYVNQPFYPMDIFYNDEYGIVGVEALAGKKWIRIL